ncbi:hypothetical protein Patl1_08023 [Pistacia atlantica]|uniref:Uncharacterized protein n=1 Tax=Pistacia atlantica TaxID=434234 RepID=A0ACC1AIH4_9ROSI|nr:hypothetical protein Patl1_08023 [Pistacia atlantica]
MAENNEFQGKKETKKRSSNTDLERASEAVVELTKEIEMEDALIKDHTRRSTRNASRNQSTVISSEVGGISHDVGKVRQLKRRREPALDEDIFVTKSKSFEEKPQRRSARNASKNDFVEPERPTGKVAGKKHQNRIRKEQRQSRRKQLANKVSTVNSDPEKAVDTAVNSEETLDSALVKQPDVSTDHVTLNSASSSTVVLEKQCSLVGDDKIEPLLDETVDKHEIKIDFGNVISSEITSPAAGLLPVKQSNDLAKPLNTTDLDKVLEAEEPSFGKTLNHGSNNVDDHINEDERASVQECQSLQLEDGEETSAAPVIQEAVFEDHLDEEETLSQKIFLQAIEIQELPAESHLVIIETATEIQLTSPVANAPEATSFFVKVNNSPADALIASNDAMEEVNKAKTQSVSLLTMLEITNENGIRKEELSGKGIEFSDEIICRGETSIGNAICGLAKTEDGVTSNKNEPDEAVPYERASQVGEKSIDDGCEENLLVGGSSIFKTPNKDETNLEHEVAAGYSLDSVEKEKEDSGNNSDNVSVETRQRCMHKLSDAKDVNLTITEERVTDVLQKTSAANLNLQSPATAGKVSFPELSLLKSHDEHGKVSSSGSKSSSCKGKQPMLDDMPKQLEEKINEDARNVFETKVQSECLPQFAIEELEEGDMRDAHSTYGKVRGFVKSAELQVIADGSSERNCTVGIVVEQTADVVKEEKAESELKVELVDRSDQENVASQVNETASTSLTEIISKEREVPDENAAEITVKPTECCGAVDGMKVEEFKAEDTNSNAEVNDVGASLAQVVSNHLVEEEATESHEGSIEMIGTAAEATTQALATKTMDFSDADNGETSIRICPVTDKTFGSEFEDVNDLAPENVLELEGSASLSSDELIFLDDRAADKEANVGDKDGNLNFRDNDIDAQQEDNVDTILQVTKSNMDDCLLRVGLYNASANIGVAADDAGETFMNEKACSQNIEDGNDATGPHLSVLPFPGIDATDMDSRFEIDDQVKQKTRHEEDKEGSNDSVEGNEQLDDHKCELLETASIDENDSSTSKEPSCSNREKSIAKVGEEGVSSEKLLAWLPLLTLKRITENKSSGFHIDSPRLTSWEMNRILGSRDQVDVEEEALRISGAMEMIENLVTDEQEKVVLVEAAATGDSVIADLDKSKAEYASVESKEADNIVVDPEATSEREVHGEEYCNGAERPEMFNEDRDKSCRDVREDNEAATGTCDTTDGFSVENNARDSQEGVKDQFDENERAAANEANSKDGVFCLALNQPLCDDDKNKVHAVETGEDGLCRQHDEVVTAADSKELVNLQNINVAYTIIPEIAVDCSGVSPLTVSSKYEESHVFTRREMNLFSGPGEHDETENSDAQASISADAREIKENKEEDLKEPTCEIGKVLTEQEDEQIIHGTPNSSPARETAPGNVWRRELNLLSPGNKCPDTKRGSKTFFAKKLNCSMRKQNSKSALIQKTPKLPLHDMKENALSAMRGKTGNITTQKALSKRRALGNLQKK